MGGEADDATLREEIADLESRLQAARSKLSSPQPTTQPEPCAMTGPEMHFLFLLTDSALPLGSFAFSSGLESYTAHRPTPSTPRQSVERFLKLSLRSLAQSTLPFLLAAHADPSDALALDDALDASTLCAVARRASTSQGRALLSVHERSFATALPASLPLDSLRHGMRAGTAFGHFPVVYGVMCALAGVDLRCAGYTFLLSHVKAVLSAAVRQSLIGPYHMQALLVSADTRKAIQDALAVGEGVGVEDVGQSVPTLDMYQGRHELLYSRVFNS